MKNKALPSPHNSNKNHVKTIDKLLNIFNMLNMKEICNSDVFDKWFIKLRDRQVKSLILVRIKRLAEGNPDNETVEFVNF